MNGIFGKGRWGEAAYVGEIRVDQIKSQTRIQWDTSDLIDNKSREANLKKKVQLLYTTVFFL